MILRIKEPEDYGGSDNMNYEQIREQRLELIRSYAKKIWKEINVKKRDWNYLTDDELRSPIIECDLPFYSSVHPFVDRGNLYSELDVVVWGSGSFSTGRVELEEWKKAKGEIEDFPVRYRAVVSNNKNSNAAKLAGEFNLPLVQIDFNEWYRDNYERNSKNPIKETGLFFPPGSELPDDIEHRFKVREEFEEELIDLLYDSTHIYADTIIFNSLRGYNFPIIHSNDWFYDDTHPADLSYVDESGNSLYPGWQSNATEKMIEDGHKLFRSSLIWAHPIREIESIQKVDSGELLALSEGIPYEGKDAKELQSMMKITEDSMLVALKAWGLFPTFWGYIDSVNVAYIRLDGGLGLVQREERNIIIGKKERSGARAFGQNLSLDLETLLYDVRTK